MGMNSSPEKNNIFIAILPCGNDNKSKPITKQKIIENICNDIVLQNKDCQTLTILNTEGTYKIFSKIQKILFQEEAENIKVPVKGQVCFIGTSSLFSFHQLEMECDETNRIRSVSAENDHKKILFIVWHGEYKIDKNQKVVILMEYLEKIKNLLSDFDIIVFGGDHNMGKTPFKCCIDKFKDENTFVTRKEGVMFCTVFSRTKSFTMSCVDIKDYSGLEHVPMFFKLSF